MRPMTLALIVLVTMVGGMNDSKAADGCGRGWYWNGYRCAPRHAYGPEVRYGYGFYDEGPRSYRRGREWNTWNGCPPGFTVQDGVCKPYRGY